MKKFIYLGLVMLLAIGSILPLRFASAATRHARGSVVVDKKVVYFLGADTRYPFPSMAVFRSWGHTSADIKTANAEDLAMPIGAPAFLNYKPEGHVDEITADGYLTGWNLDRNHPEYTPITQLYIDGIKTKVEMVSDEFLMAVYREDVNKVFGSEFANGAYGFSYPIPEKYRDGKQHLAYVYGIDLDDTEGKTNVLLKGSPFKFKIAPMTAPLILDYQAGTDNDFLSTKLSWNVIPSNSAVTISSINGALDAKGEITVYPSGPTTYTLTATYNGQSVHTDLLIEPGTDKPTITYFGSYEDKIKPGKSTVIEWDTDRATVVTLDGLPVGLYGTQNVTLSANKTYTLAATNVNGTTTKQITITVQTDASLRDAQRVEDILTILFGLVIYGEDHQNKFPDSLQSMGTSYLSTVPVAPTPPDGACSSSDNEYVYTPSADRTNFTLKFCLGTADDLAGTPLTAGVNILDYQKLLADSQAKAGDAKRIADIRQIQTSLELFYNDNNRYPTALNGIVNINDGSPKWSTYMFTWPTAPTPPGGNCSTSQNAYGYEQLSSGNDYRLTFCLGAATSVYSAGPRTASPSGIQ